jgi:hypothetical protein
MKTIPASSMANLPGLSTQGRTQASFQHQVLHRRAKKVLSPGRGESLGISNRQQIVERQLRYKSDAVISGGVGQRARIQEIGGGLADSVDGDQGAEVREGAGETAARLRRVGLEMVALAAHRAPSQAHSTGFQLNSGDVKE